MSEESVENELYNEKPFINAQIIAQAEEAEYEWLKELENFKDLQESKSRMKLKNQILSKIKNTEAMQVKVEAKQKAKEKAKIAMI